MKEISVTEMKTILEENPSVHLLDVREPDERAEFHFGGTLFPLGKIMSFQLEDIEDFKEEPVYVYCRSGKRSMQACMILEQAGFADVTNVAGGILAWQDAFGK